ncbi:hypothetical protein ACFO9Q_16800 [Paenibacillus sp. GCM10023252]|uniref:hypothetical protein n=1 Tax=Paenibacillus sp. GCM10023252 TaxID=3252649 RepID=UPI00361F7AFC
MSKLKRYGLSIALCLLIVIIISTYYVQAAIHTLPELTLVTIDGDEKIADKLVLEGGYFDGTGNTVELTSKGSTYSSEQSLPEKLLSRELERRGELVKKYPGFMRGKNSSYLYENSESVVSVEDKFTLDPNGDNHQFNLLVDKLDKKTKKSSSFEIEIKQEGLNWVFVYDFYLKEGNLEIVAELLSGPHVNRKTEYHLYTIDIAKQEIADDTKIQLLEPDPSAKNIKWQSQYFIGDRIKGRKVTKLLFSQIEVSMDSNGNIQERTENVPIKWISYDPASEQQEELPIPKNYKLLTNQLLGDYFVVVTKENGTYRLSKYNLITNQLEQQYDLEGNSNLSIKKISAEGIILLGKVDDKTQVEIIDMASGKLKFKGSVEVEGTPKEQLEWSRKVDFHTARITQ